MNPLLVVRVSGEEIARVGAEQPPCELTPSARISPGDTVEFEDPAGSRHTHSLGQLSGWAHFSVRVHPWLVCQADCILTQSDTFDPRAIRAEEAQGVRFEPFFLPGAHGSRDVRGRGLFRRGLHFSGTVTPAWVTLSCECDDCGRSFLVSSFHAGFGSCEYLYSGSGRYTLVLAADTPGAPGPLGAPDAIPLQALEASLPKAPDGTAFKYLNPFRCPHCGAAYIDFERYPDQRPGEYYGNTLFGVEPIRWPA